MNDDKHMFFCVVFRESGGDARANDDNGSEDECAELRHSECGGESALLPQPKYRLTGSLKELLSCSKF